MINKTYYFSLFDMMEETPFSKNSLSSFLCGIFGEDTSADLIANYQVPSDIASNSAYDELWSLVYGRYYEKAFIKVVKPINETPTSDEINEEANKWAYRLVSLLNMTYQYYTTLLGVYGDAKTHLMDDIKALSTTKVRFNDTPQATNLSGTYEGDNYITNFTKSDGETSSPLMSKMMRLKEIQENYHNVMADWVKKFERLFFEEEC